jgi:ABC-type transport system substrate-binding protein
VLRVAMAVIVVTALAMGTTAAAVPRAVSVDPNGILKYGIDLTASGAGGVISLDPATIIGSPFNIAPARLIYDTLVRQGPKGPEPGLATAWRFPDQQTIDLTLRKGATFQDGTPFNAAAVKFGLQRTMAANNPNLDKNFAQLDSVEALDDSTVRLHLKTPVLAAFFNLLSAKDTFIVSPTAVQKEGSDFAAHPVGAGPYSLKEFTPEQLISLRKYKGFWQKSGWKLAGVDFVQSANGPSEVTALLSNEVDMIPVPDDATRSALAGHPGVTVNSQASDSSVAHFDMCTTTPPFDKLAVRRAIAYAIDRKALNEAGTGGIGVVTDQPYPPGSVFYTRSAANRYPYSVAKAKTLLKGAGLPSGFDFDVMIFPSPTFQTQAEVLQSQLAKVGIKTKIVASPNYVSDLFTDNKAPTTVSFTINPGVGKIASVTPTSIADWCHFNDPKVTAGIDELNSAVGDVATQKAAWTDINKVIVDQVPMIFLYFNPVSVGYSNNVGGVQQLYGTSQGPNFQTVYLKKGA